jgi:hypothetical protein
MADVVILSKRQLGGLRKYIDQIQNDELQGYLAEAERCLGENAPRAAFVLAWSALIYYLRQTILLVGFDSFRRAVEERLKNWDPEKAQHLSPKNWDDGRLKDWELLQACEGVGIIGEAERTKLQHYAELRNDCAHPSQALVFPGEALSLFEYLFKYTSIAALDGWFLPIPFFEQRLVDPDQDLDNQRVRGWIELLSKKDRLPLVSKLLDWYRDPYRFVKEDDDFRREKIAINARQRVPVLWTALADKLDSNEKAKANTQVAKALPYVQACILGAMGANQHKGPQVSYHKSALCIQNAG